MNSLLKLQNKNGRDVLSYRYKKVQDIDDVILQLLNEADIEGFARNNLDKAAGEVDYDITGYAALTDLQPVRISVGELYELMNHLYRLLAYLEDSFIDVEYVMFEPECMFIEPDNKRLHLVVLPCQESMDSNVLLSDCVEKIVGSFTYNHAADGACIRQVVARIRDGIDSLIDLQDILYILQNANRAAEEDRLHENQIEEATVVDLNLDDFDFPEEDEEAEPAAMPEEAVEAAVKTEVPSAADEMAPKLREELYQELREEVAAELRQELRGEITEELHRELCAEVVSVLRQELREEVAEELRRELRAEVQNELRQEVHAWNHRMPYLICKKTGEVVQVDKDTFIIGKMAVCCDYVITNNNSVSRLHAVIKYNEQSDDYFIIDCNSTNHIYLNGRRIASEQPVTLEDGMYIHLATEEFVFQIRG